MAKQQNNLPILVEEKIYLIRGHRVMLDEDLAQLYGTETRRLNEQVKRNEERFPNEFMFQLTEKEFENLKSQDATSGWGGRRKLPYAFTEHGTLMLASVLKSKTAIDASIEIIKVFVKLREMLASNKLLAKKLEEMEKKYDKQFLEVFSTIRQLMGEYIPEYEKKVLNKGKRD